jgi:hypothetical protein
LFSSNFAVSKIFEFSRISTFFSSFTYMVFAIKEFASISIGVCSNVGARAWIGFVTSKASFSNGLLSVLSVTRNLYY